ncbi:hypothetical protein [Desulfovibrio inopinatus]|uniref:hypothetical protein n=1 Tax=Desulfovibrio inopinatus TaxID=102109 RepID=UPI00040C7A26|nr:hypothetical protein [Desulfovibrio inopinatus]
MHYKTISIVCVVLICILINPVFSLAQTPDSETQDTFHWSVVPYAWLTGLNGTIGARGYNTSISAPFVDLANYLKFGAMIHLEGNYADRIGVFTDFNYSLLGDEASGKRISLDGKTSLLLTDIAAFYRLGSFPLSQANKASVSFDVLAGVRIWSLSLLLDGDRARGGRDIFENRSWVDPLIGARAEFHFAKDWLLNMRGGVGGFSISSALTWDAMATIGYTFWEHGTLLLGYRAVGVNHTEGSGQSAFTFDVTLSGPILGLAFTF